jgi:Tfp pilus assembly protein PilF
MTQKLLGLRVGVGLSCFALFLTGCASFSKPSKKEVAGQWVALAGSAIQDGDTTGALQYLARAEQDAPSDPALHHTRALAFSQRKDLGAATESARRAHALAPSDSAISTTLGKLLLEAGKYREAEKILLPAANDSLYRDAYRARTNLAFVYLKLGERPAAAEQLDRAINEASGLACHAYYLRAQMQVDDGRFNEALKDLDLATRKICASFAQAHLSIGTTLTKARRYGEARKKFVEISQLFPKTDIAEKALENLRYLP